MYDVIIIGSGPAGLAAAIYAKRAALETLVLEKTPLSGGRIINTYEVDNYPGLPDQWHGIGTKDAWTCRCGRSRGQDCDGDCH